MKVFNQPTKSVILEQLKGRYVNGFFTKKDGQSRQIWGQIINEDRDPVNILTVFDKRLKQYRRLDISRNYSIKSGTSLFLNVSSK